MKNILKWLVAMLVVSVAPGVWAITFGNPVQISSLSNFSYAPRLAASGNNVYMVWTTMFGSNGDGSGDVYFARSADNGASWSAPASLANRAGQPDYWPFVAASGSNVHVFWSTEPNNPGGAILYRRSTDGGASFGAINTLFAASNGATRTPQAVVGANGRIHVVWQSNANNGASSDVYYAVSCDGGASFTAGEAITRLEGFTDAEHPRIAEGTDGTLYILFRTSRQAVAQSPQFLMALLRGSPQGGCGTSWTTPGQSISPSYPDRFANVQSGNIIAGPGNTLYTAWWDSETGNDIVFRKGAPQGAGFLPAQRLSDLGRTHLPHDANLFDVGEPVLAGDGVARVALVYNRNSALTPGFIQYGEVYYQESLDAGSTFAAPINLSPSNTGLTPSVLIANGRVHVAWAEVNTTNGLANIVYRSALAGPDPNADDDGDGVPNGIEAQEGLNPAVKDNDVFANTAKGRRLFVMQMVRDLYYREATAAEITAGVNALTAGTTRAALADQLMSAPEHEDLVGPQVRLYFAYFLRLPDYGGLSFWVTQYRTRPGSGWSFEGISEFFSLSPEFQQRYGALNTDQFVTLIYNNVLSRAPEPGGFAFWTSELNSGRRIRGNVMAAFSEAPENKLLKTADVRVVASYFGLLRAMPDQASFNSWVAQIKAGTSSQVLINQLIANPVYRARFLP